MNPAATQSRSPRVLCALTSHVAPLGAGETTGVWIEELATPFYRLRDAGCRITLASPNGGPVAIAPQSLVAPAGQTETVVRWLSDDAALAQLAATARLDAVTFADYDAIVIPGGHGALWDLPANTALTAALGQFLTGGRLVAAICHGPAALINVLNATGEPIVAGRTITAFTNSEERAAGLTKTVPWLLETRLREQGALFRHADDFAACHVIDGNLITGQNPASAAAVADALLALLLAPDGQGQD